MEVVKDFEARPHKAVSFVVESEKEIQEWNEQKMPKVMPNYSGSEEHNRSWKRSTSVLASMRWLLHREKRFYAYNGSKKTLENFRK